MTRNSFIQQNTDIDQKKGIVKIIRKEIENKLLLPPKFNLIN